MEMMHSSSPQVPGCSARSCPHAVLVDRWPQNLQHCRPLHQQSRPRCEGGPCPRVIWWREETTTAGLTGTAPACLARRMRAVLGRRPMNTARAAAPTPEHIVSAAPLVFQLGDAASNVKQSCSHLYQATRHVVRLGQLGAESCIKSLSEYAEAQTPQTVIKQYVPCARVLLSPGSKLKKDFRWVRY